MVSKPIVFTIIGGVALAFLVCGWVHFDKKRRASPDYKQRVRERREKERTQKTEISEEELQILSQLLENIKKQDLPLPDKNNAEACQAYVVSRLEAGQAALILEQKDRAIEYFAAAVAYTSDPYHLLMYFQQYLDREMLEKLICSVDADVFIDKYFKTFPGDAAPGIEIEVLDVQKYQRRIVAKKDFAKGDAIASETSCVSAFADYKFESDHCAHCHGQFVDGNKVICDDCKKEAFCSSECFKLAIQRYHKMTCFKTLDNNPYNDLLDFAKKRKTSDSIIALRFLSCMFNIDNEYDFSRDFKHLYFNEEKFKINSDEEQEFEYIKNIIRAKVVGLEIGELFTLENYRQLLNKIHYNKIGYSIKEDGFNSESDLSEFSGYGIFLIGCYFNHSCNPNMEVCFLGNKSKASYIALKDIKTGDEITRDYAPHLLDKAKKHAFLEKQYNFVCNCEKK